MDEYIYLLIIWLFLILFLRFYSRYMSIKMKNAEDRQTKNTLFTLYMMLAIPVFFAVTLVPILIIAGDEFMPVIYKIIFGVIVLIILILVYFERRKKVKSDG